LTHVHVFPYSDRPGTVAACLPDKVHGAAIRQRAEALRAVGASLTERFVRSQVGGVRRGLTLEDGTLVLTDNYLKVRVRAGVERNTAVDVRVDALTDGGLVGTII
jgi:threonylcarbamoyladenosine tRNA methylthiotransferase MtaB